VLSRLPRADGAAFDSLALQHEPLCLDNTRVDLLNKLMAWADKTTDEHIFWLNGMAGTGKSTIARTVARKWAAEKRLGASFFFSRGQGDRTHAARFFTTLAYQLASPQLASSQPDLAIGVCNAIHLNPDIAEKSLDEQWKQLIFDPLSRLNGLSLILVIDALDECDDERDIKLILRLLSEAKKISSVRLQVFVTSRPETPICLGFDDITKAAYQHIVLHEIPKQIVSPDIFVFIQREFAEIRNNRCIPGEWPDKSSLDVLVEKADGLFIYAATICRFIGQKGCNPRKRLTVVLEGSMKTGSPTKELDSIYTKILQNAIIAVEGHEPEEEEGPLQQFRRIVGSIVILFDALTANALAQLLDTDLWEVVEMLGSLSSVMSHSESQGSHIRLLHPSFRDFLLDNRRCCDSRFSIAAENAHADLLMNCLKLMSRHLKQDICSLRLPGCLTSDVDPSTVQRCLPEEVQYACRYWVDHLERSKVKLCDNDSLQSQVHNFLKEHFLHWLEALSLMGNMSDGVLMVKNFDSMLTVSDPKHR
jgi:hypothetical protein